MRTSAGTKELDVVWVASEFRVLTRTVDMVTLISPHPPFGEKFLLLGWRPIMGSKSGLLNQLLFLGPRLLNANFALCRKEFLCVLILPTAWRWAIMYHEPSGT